eukprot:jgi/Botrbrau1/18785/Bobra.0386s0101.1
MQRQQDGPSRTSELIPGRITNMQSEIRPGRQLWVEVLKGSKDGRFFPSSAVVVFVHGACANLEQFRGQKDVLVEAGLTTILYDHLGCGKSAKPRSPPTAYHPDEMTADLHQLLQRYTKGFKHIYIIGHSFGTGMVTRVVAEAGDRVRGVVLLGAVSPQPVPQAPLRIFSLPECVLGWLQPLLTQGFLERAFHAHTFKEQPDLVETERKSANSNPPYMFKAFHTQARHMWHPAERFQGWLKKVTPKTLVIAGEDDRLTPVQMASDVVASLPNAELVVIPHAGHQVMQEKPEEVNQLILKLIEQSLPSTS